MALLTYMNPFCPRTRKWAVSSSAVLRREANAPKTVPGEPDALGLYLSEIGRYPLLDRDGEARLASAVQLGMRAREELSQPGQHSAERQRQLEQLARAGQQAAADFAAANLRNRALVSLMVRRHAGSRARLDR